MAQLAGTFQTPAQGVPDIAWQTNAHAAPVTSVSFSTEGDFLASGSEDRKAKVWTMSDRRLTRTISTPNASVMAVAITPDGTLLLTGGDDGVARMWAINTGLRIWGGSPNNDIVWSVALSRDGLVAAASGTLKAIGVVQSDGSGGHYLEAHSADVYSVVFSPDGAKLASASADGTAKIWRLSDSSVLYTLTGHSIFNPTNEDENVYNSVWSVDISPDGTMLATTGADDKIRIWHMVDGTQARTVDCAGCGTAKFSSDGKLLMVLQGSSITIIRVADGKPLTMYANAGATCLAIAANGKYFAYGRGDGAVVIAYLPLILEITRDDQRIILRWSGGSGLYQVQRRNDPIKGKWHDVGHPTTAMSVTNKLNSQKVFYRVQSLPNP